MQDFEKLGSFYLGKAFDMAAGKSTDDLLLYESKDLTTHAVCVGMTGSGKTGLCLALLEEAAIDGVPAIAIDPKGDLGNLLLTFPELRPEDFRPWIDPAEAKRKGLTEDQYAEKTANTWRDGLAQWGEDGARIKRFKDAVDIAIYTPGSSAGLPLTVLRSFSAPAAAIRDDSEALRDRIASSVAGLLALLGIDADPIRSREHILLSNILDRAWRAGRDLEMGSLIHEIQEPPFNKVGVMDLESFFPAKERFELAMSLNNLLASPGFSAWMEGEPLDIQRLLYTAEGQPRLSVISIAHLDDAERMFFMTILLGEVIAWMRAQPGTSSLRALLYMDEIFGYFPPSANPPSKTPMLTLLKQARAYGLGVVLATQNPVDLDYKGLSNAGTWFLGRLQTERDKNRVLDGLEGASTAAGAKFNRSEMEKVLSGLGNRVFLMNNVHEDAPVVFQSRWALSYLCGPLTREQISRLMQGRKAAVVAGPVAVVVAKPQAEVASSDRVGAPSGDRPVLPPWVPQVFVESKERMIPQFYKPALFATVSTGRVDDCVIIAPITEQSIDTPWNAAAIVDKPPIKTADGPWPSATFMEVPSMLTTEKRFKKLESELKEFITLQYARKTDIDRDMDKEQIAYDKKRKELETKAEKIQQAIQKAKAERWKRIWSFISKILTVLPALFLRWLSMSSGKSRIRKVATQRDIAQITSAGNVFGRAMSDENAAPATSEDLEAVKSQLEELEKTHAENLGGIKQRLAEIATSTNGIVLAPKTSNINRVALAWLPYETDGTGQEVPLIEMSCKSK